jgi:hypothetical protein
VPAAAATRPPARPLEPSGEPHVFITTVNPRRLELAIAERGRQNRGAHRAAGA